VVDVKTFMVKGAPMAADLAYIRQRFGTDGLEQVLAAMRPDFAEIYRHKLLASTWYTMEFRMALLYALDAVYAKGDMDFFFGLGCHQAEHNINNYYRAFMRIVGPARTAKIGGMIWRLVYKTGSIKVAISDKVVEVVTQDYPLTHKLNCHVIRGYIHRSLEYSGISFSEIKSSEPTCINEGDENCKFVFRWV
jgi:hypothetical protein